MFIVSLSYKVELSQVEKFLDEHIEYLKKQYASHKFILSGRKVPRTGGVILSNLTSKEELMETLREDPFYREDLADYDVTELVPSMASEPLKFLLD